jgi:type 1 glutamine amidotransferase
MTVSKFSHGKRTMKRYFAFIIVCAALLPMFIPTLNAQDSEEKPLKVLIIDDHRPGYYNMPTATTLRNILRQDKQLEVVLVEDAEVLGADLPFDYDVIVLHFKNYLIPKRAEAMKANLEIFVTEGGGLFVFHFACGAFEDWQGFEKLAGRVWEPKKRPHDPYGTFAVQVVDKVHPITKGLNNFEISDELYTCLRDSEVPIHVLAEAVSKVDNKSYPMAFTLEKGKGRIFHSTLGHDEKSLSSAEFQIMCKRAVVWCANRE